jgi:predicted dehydrogenase
MRFAVIGLDHRHIYDLTAGLLDAGAVCAGFCPVTSDPRVLAGFGKRFPQIPATAREALLDDPTVDFIVTAAVPRDRAGIAVAAMLRGKDVMVDKPGLTTFAQLDEVRDTVAKTGKIFSVCFSERLLTPCTAEALRLVRAGAIGRVVQTVGLGPHRLNRAIRPSWFWERDAYGGILVDIGCHQIDQFMAFTDAESPTIAQASVGRFAARGDFDDFGEMILRGERATGYARVDWFTADGLATWGDGRLTVLGTEGTIELRKHIDIAGRPGTDHLFLVDNAGTRYICCEDIKVTYFSDFLHDVAARAETVMTQAHVFTVCRLALEAQARATRVP